MGVVRRLGQLLCFRAERQRSPYTVFLISDEFRSARALSRCWMSDEPNSEGESKPSVCDRYLASSAPVIGCYFADLRHHRGATDHVDGMNEPGSGIHSQPDQDDAQMRVLRSVTIPSAWEPKPARHTRE